LAGFVGFLLATAIDQIGANRAFFQAPTTKISVPEVPVSTFDRRQDRSNQSEQQTAKADRMDSRPARESTHLITEAPVTNAEISDLPALSSPIRLGSWVEEVTTFDAAAPGPIGQIAPDLRDAPPSGTAPTKGLPFNLQGPSGKGSTADRPRKAASGIAGKAAGAFGI